MDRIFHQLTVLTATAFVGVLSFSILFSATNSDQLADLSSKPTGVAVEFSN